MAEASWDNLVMGLLAAVMLRVLMVSAEVQGVPPHDHDQIVINTQRLVTLEDSQKVQDQQIAGLRAELTADLRAIRSEHSAILILVIGAILTGTVNLAYRVVTTRKANGLRAEFQLEIARAVEQHFQARRGRGHHEG